MIITRISGGLGNQMFQYALGKHLSFKNKTELKIDTEFFESKIEEGRSFELSKFNISVFPAEQKDFAKIKIPEPYKKNITSRVLRKLFILFEKLKPIYKRRFILEDRFDFYPEILDIQGDCYLSGVWQSQKYFKDIEESIRKDFTPKDEPSHKFKEWLFEIESSQSVSIHIRRGDYIKNPKTNNFHGTCSLEYYQSAVSFILEKIENPSFFVFSDDIEWAKENLKINHPLYFVSDGQIADWEELIIMSKCRHNIIANSTFSWWGAWLNSNTNKIVIAPKKWFNDSRINTADLIPENWIRI